MAIDFPRSLPCPQTETVTPFDRGQRSDDRRPREARALSLDRLALVRATWPPLSPEQAETFYSFWKEDLFDGGAWFNAIWPLPQGKVPAVFKFLEQPRWRFVPGGRWRVEALLEQRGRTLQVNEPTPVTPTVEIAWRDPVNGGSGGALLRANSGVGDCSDFVGGGITTLYAGIVGYTAEAYTWSIASWTPTDGGASPTIEDLGGGNVAVYWQNSLGPEAAPPPIYDASIGELVLTCEIDGVTLGAGERLTAVTTPDLVDYYANIAWGPEP